MKKSICFILVLLLTLSPVISQAALIESLDYWPGGSGLNVDALDCISVTNGEKTSSSVVINAGGNAVWGFYLPYNSRSLTLTHEGSGDAVIKIGENSYNVVLSSSGTTQFEFGTNLGYEQQYRGYNTNLANGFMRDFVEHRGEKEVIIIPSNSIEISNLFFEKEKTPAPKNDPIPDISSEAMDSLSTVMMHENASIIVVNGGRRYIDNSNIDEKPYNYEGSLYLPIEVLAKALGYYHEDIPEKGYALMRSDSHEVVLLGDKCTVSEGINDAEIVSKKAFIYKNGKTYAAIRFFAELNGETVGYKDGLVVIDNKYTVDDILSEPSFYSYAVEKFNDFILEKIIGKTYYVAQSSSASDLNIGSAIAPFRTLEKAASVAKPGDTIIIREGVYRETLTPKHSGSANAPITYKAAEGDKVIISANDVLDNIVLYDNEKNIYVTQMDIDLGVGRNQIFVNGEVQTEARYPNGPSYLSDGRLGNLWGVKGNMYKVAGDTTTISSDTLFDQNEVDYWAGATFVGQFGESYALLTGQVESSTNGKITIGSKRNPRWWDNWASGYSEQGTRSYLNYGYLTNTEKALDAPGEWFRNSDGKLKIILPEVTTDELPTVEAKTRQVVIDIADKKFINIEGIETIGGGIKMNDSEMCMLNGMNMKYISHYTLNADSRRGYIDYPFDTNDKDGAPQRGEVGIYIGGTDNIVVNSVIDHSAGAGIYTVGLYTYIENNIIKDCGYMGSYVSGIHADVLNWDDRNAPRGGYSIYNNTIYNCGRACIDLVRAETDNGVSMPYAPFLPCEIAYNDLHDANITAADTAMIYTNGVTLGFDNQMTQVHHNYIYTTFDKSDIRPYMSAIYWDNTAFGADTYSNVMFTSEPHAGFTMGHVMQQPNLANPAYDRIWDNHELGYVNGGVSSLEKHHFTEEKMFFAGADLLNDFQYVANYDKFAQGVYAMEYRALNAEHSDGVVINAENGYASFAGDGEYLHFENVDFGTFSDEISISVRGDSHHTLDEIEIIIGTSMEDGLKYSTTARIDSPDLDQSHTIRVPIFPESGAKDVWVRIAKYNSVCVGGISIYSSDNDMVDDSFAHFAYASMYTSYDSSSNYSGLLTTEPSRTIPNAAVFGLQGTFSGTTLKYANQHIKEEVSEFIIYAGSRDQYRKQRIQVYIDDPNGTPVADFEVLNRQFYIYDPIKVPLKRNIEAGTYDIYIKFSGTYTTINDGTTVDNAKTSNVLGFGFLKTGSDTSKFSTHARVFGSMFDTALSVQNPDRPFYMLNGPEWYTPSIQKQTGKIMYTLPETVAVYKEVDVVGECRKFTINYSADPNYDGQPINVRLGGVNGEIVATVITEGFGSEIFNTVSVETLRPIEDGVYDVYLDFGANSEGKGTCQLYWFNFSE